MRNLCRTYLSEEGYAVTWLGVDGNGELNLDELRSALRPDTALVSDHACKQRDRTCCFRSRKLVRIVREQSEAAFHVDGVQAVGKVPIDLKNTSVDLFALSGHKLHAPQGIGALYIRKGLSLPSFIIGGAQEQGRRAGTSAVPNIVGLGAACQLALDDNIPRFHRATARPSRRRESSQTFQTRVSMESPIVRSVCQIRRTSRSNTSTAKTFSLHLDQADICVSTGSACHSTTHESSPTLRAMNVPFTAAQGSIRFSLGRYNTEADIDTDLARTFPESSRNSPPCRPTRKNWPGVEHDEVTGDGMSTF